MSDVDSLVAEKRKMKVSGTVDDEFYRWMKKKISNGTFYNPSHAIQRGLVKPKEEEDRTYANPFSLVSIRA